MTVGVGGGAHWRIGDRRGDLAGRRIAFADSGLELAADRARRPAVGNRQGRGGHIAPEGRCKFLQSVADALSGGECAPGDGDVSRAVRLALQPAARRTRI